MRITGSKAHLQAAAKAGAADADGPNKSAKREASASSVVSLRSGRLARSSEVYQAVAARLESVREQLSNGNYPIDYAKLADNLVADAVERGDIADD